jgi:hypothetical protein
VKSKMIYLPDETVKKCFFHLKLIGNSVRVTIDGQDPFLRAKLTRIEQSKYNIDGRNVFLLSIDTTAHRVIGSGPNEYSIPRVKEAR